MRVVAERARVLVVVKASPQPSGKYRDTVCVAGVRLDSERPSWVRLYPVPFRWISESAQFTKYDVVDVSMRRRDTDSRPESYVPDVDSIEIVDHYDTANGWARRSEIISQLPAATTCGLAAAAKAAHNAPSLGVVQVVGPVTLEFEKHPGWSEAERAKIAQSMNTTELSLFGNDAKPGDLRAPRFKVRYRYRCGGPDCRSHQGQILDWELTALQNRNLRRTDEDLKGIVREKFLDMMFSPKRVTSLFMGNFEDPTKRDKFSVLGVFYPELAAASQQPLF